MKRLWGCCALLLVLLGGCLWNSWHIYTLMSETAVQLEEAQSHAVEENWDKALELTQQVRKSWSDQEFYLKMVLSHRDVDQITRGMAQTEETLIHHSIDQYAPTNRDVVEQLRILGEMEMPHLVNIL